MKAILVLDKPKNCEDCPLFRTDKDFNATINYCMPYQDKELFMVKEKGISEKCPLKPMPTKKEIYERIYQAYGHGNDEIYQRIRQAVEDIYDEILGAEE